MEIRPMKQEDDRYLIGRIYEESWKSAYRDIIPQSYRRVFLSAEIIGKMRLAGKSLEKCNIVIGSDFVKTHLQKTSSIAWTAE